MPIYIKKVYKEVNINLMLSCSIAGSAVDDFIAQLEPLLEEGDIIIDGGNSEYQDSQRRTKTLAQKGLLFVGSGVSGGEEGARYGPSLMPGGNPKAWPHIKDIFQVSIVLLKILKYCLSIHLVSSGSIFWL
jgi:6-phosphogluconate dehydrogenase